jgi:hypothetical protein
MCNIYFEYYLQSNLSGHKNIIGYVDSNITHTGGGVHELLLLMPYCKSQVLQMMNNRLRLILLHICTDNISKCIYETFITYSCDICICFVCVHDYKILLFCIRYINIV